MEDKTPEDVAFEKLTKRSGKQYDKIMPQADTTFEKLPYKPGMDKGDVKPLPQGKSTSPSIEEMMKPKKRRSDEVTPLAKGGSVSSASKRADGIAQRGKTRGMMIAMFCPIV